MDDTVHGLSKGSRVWWRKDPATWLLAEIKSHASSGSLGIQLLTGQPGKTVEGLQDGQGLLVPANPALQQAIPDLTQLSYLNEPSILDNLTQRYTANNIYTNAGPVLIAVNPCKNLPLYTAQVAQEYKAGAFEAVNKLSPHIYLVAGAAFRDMVRQNSSQSLVINGESGAGKTETTKKAMQFFAALAGGTGVEDQVLETNPILESFGNAKTLRNHNSSRFGKLIEIHFNKTNHICGARIRTYLLEKSRVVHQLKGERSFHIFYQLVRGGGKDKALKAALKLPNKPQEFAYLSKSGCVDIDGVDDVVNFQEVLAALKDIGVQQQDVDTLLATLSGILWLGNLKLEAVYADDSSKVKADAALSNAAQLLGLSEQDLAYAITHKKIKTRDELIVKPLTAQEAVDARDALAKALYSGVFNWIVAAVNAKLDMGKKGSGRFIAILDIYGFEQFQVNSFEQLCINYANERLQQQFTRHLFTLEQEEYESEGIDWTKVEWVDNQACVDVIEAMPPKGLGVLAVLDSQCRFPKGSDDTFMIALRDQLLNNDHFGVNPRKQDEFIISHYAGPVTYNTAGFLDKNKDMLNTDLVELLQTSGSSLVQSIGDEAAGEMDGKRGGQTVSSRFTGQLKELVSMLDATGLHFVRCIKPNAALSPGQLSLELVLQQLRCCGVLEVARVSRAGYPTRYRHADFVSRYKILLPREQQGIVLSNEAQTRAAVLQLLGVFKVADGQYEMGRTKVFFKPGVLGYVEDTWAKMHAGVLKLQAFTRMRRARHTYLQARAAALLYQSSWRARSVRLTYGKELSEHKAAIAIQSSFRRHAAQQEYQRVRHATRTIQAAHRRQKLEQRVAVRVAERTARERAEFEAREAVRRREEGFDALKDEYGIKELSEVKAALACYAALRGELDSRDPEEVQEALALLAVVRRTAGDASGAAAADLSPQQLKQALLLSSACQAQLGPEVDAQQLQAALATAAVCKQQLGDSLDQQQLQDALSTAAVCKQQLGSYDQEQLTAALSTAAECKQELGGSLDKQQVHEALELAGIARQQLGSSCDAQQLQAALAMAVVCEQQLGGYDQERLQAAVGAAEVCSKEAGSLDPEQLRQRLVMAESARQQLGGLDERHLVQGLTAANMCRQLLGEHDMRYLHEALATAAMCHEQIGSWDRQQLQQALSTASVCREQLGNGFDQQQLQQALSTAAVCKQQLGDDVDQQQLQEALAAAAVCKQQLGDSFDQQQLQDALTAAAACKQQLGDSFDQQQLQEALAAAAVCKQQLGDGFDQQHLQEALTAAAVCKQQLGSFDQQQLEQRLLLADAAEQQLGGSCDVQQLQTALSAAAVCKEQLGDGSDVQQLKEALAAARTCMQELGSYDEQQLQQRLAAAEAAIKQLGSLDEIQQALTAAVVCRESLGSYNEHELKQRLMVAEAASKELGSCDAAEVQQALATAHLCKDRLGSLDQTQLQRHLSIAEAANKGLGSGVDEQQVQQAVAIAALCERELGTHDQQQLQAALAVAAACKQQLGSYDQQQLQQQLVLAHTVQQQLGSGDEAQLQAALQAAAVAHKQLGSYDQEQLQQQLALANKAAEQLGSADEQQLLPALQAAAVVKAQLGSYNADELAEALAAAAACKQELGIAGNAEQLQQSLGIVKVVQQQLNGSSIDKQQLRLVLQLGHACQQAGLEQPAQLNGKLQLAAAAASAASPEDVAAALELQQAVLKAAGPAASHEQVTAALQLHQAAEEQGIHDASSLQAALAAAASAAAAAAAVKATTKETSGVSQGVDSSHAVLGSVAVASGVTDPDELQVALHTYRQLRPALQAHGNDPKLARRACSMYAAAVTHGIADKRDFMAAAALYGVLREDGITSAGELRLAVAMYTAVREEGILDPDDLHTAIRLATVARDEGLGEAAELAEVLATSRGGLHLHGDYLGAAAAGSNGLYSSSSGQHLGSLRAMGGLEASEGSAAAALQQQVLKLQSQLEAEKAARSRYARQLEQQAVEWMGQVKLLKEYIDSLRAKMPQSSAAGMPNLKMPSGLQGVNSGGSQGSDRRTSDPASNMLAGLEGDWATKAPLFDDDAAFIREVVDGEVLAPDMQVQMELDRLRQKYEAWSKQFKQRMRDAQAALRRRQGGGGPPGHSLSLSSSGPLGPTNSLGVRDSMGVSGVMAMVSNPSGDASAVATYAAGPTQAAHPAGSPVQESRGGGGAGMGSLSPSSTKVPLMSHKASVNVRKMPDLNAPDLLSAGEPGGSSDGGRKKKGVLGRMFG